METRGIQAFADDFEDSSEILQAWLKKCQEIHKEFLSRFPKDKLKKILTLDKYVIGKGRTDTFCYWVERKTKPLGSILGARSDKFKIYFDKKTKKYRWVRGFKTAGEAFKRTKSEIINILNAAQKDDLEAIKNNRLFRQSHMFRGKILYLYFPYKFANVFAEEDIDYFLDRLGVEYSGRDHVLDKQMKLLEYKNSATPLRSWSNLKFRHFLYDQFEPPSRTLRKSFSPKKKITQTTKDLLEEEKAYVLPNPEDANLVEINLDEIAGGSQALAKVKGRRRKANYLLESLRNQKLGDQAEEIVLRYEKHELAGCNRRDLMRKVKRVSLEDDSLGYDISSYTEEGKAKYIEVKATKSGVDARTPFYLTDRQRQMMERKRGQYFIYRVYSANKRNPRLLKINHYLMKAHLEMKTKLWEVSIKPGGAK